MKVFGHPFSTCTRIVLTSLHEKSADFEFVLIDFSKGEHKRSPHIDRQPFGVVPAIEDNGFSMFESRAIIRYVDESLPGASLTPSDVRTRAQMNQWISIEQSNFTPAAMKIIYQRFLVPMQGGQPNEAIVEVGRTELKKVLEIMERHLTGKTYLVGERYTLADLVFLPYIDYLFRVNSGDLIEASPNVAAWWGRISSRPAWLKASGQATQA